MKNISAAIVWKVWTAVLLVALLWGVNSSIVNAQHATLTGVVKADDTQPLPMAMIKIENTNSGMMSDINGEFIFRNLAAGDYTITASYLGYQADSKKISLKEDTRVTLVFILKKETKLLDEVVVAYDATDQIKDNGFAVNAIKTKDIEIQSVQANELLDQVAGVRIRQDGGMGSRVRYNINGLSGNAIRIFLDGIPIENYGRSFSLSSIPTSLIERIEVYKGVVPAELGNDALGGAINVVSKKASANSLSTAYSFGSFNTHQWGVNGNYRNRKNGITVRGSAFYNYSDNNYKVWGDQVYLTNSKGKIEYVEAERFHDAYQSLGAKIDLGLTEVKWADQFFVGAVLSEMDKDIQHGAIMATVYGNRTMQRGTTMVYSSYSKEGFLTDQLDVNLFASHSSLTRKVVDTVAYIYNWRGERADYNNDGEWDAWLTGAEAGNPTLSENDEKTRVARANVLYRLNPNNKVSVNYLVSAFERRPDDPLRPKAERDLIDTRYLTKSILGFNYANVALAGKLKTSVFFKYFHQSVSLKDALRTRSGLTAYEYHAETNNTGFGLALSYVLHPKLTLMTSAEDAVRLPQNHEIFGNSAQNINPAYELKPEQSRNVNLGFKLGPFTKLLHEVSVNTNFFYRDTKGMIRQVVESQQEETFQYENQEKVLSKGLDVELNYQYNRRFTNTFGLSLFNARFNKQYDVNGAQYIYYGDRLRNQPYFTLNNNMRYSFKNLIQSNSALSVYYNLGYVHAFFRDWESLGNAGKDVIPTQLVNDLGLAYTFPNERLTLSADAKNILNEQVFDNWALQKPGRAFYIKVNYKLK